MMKKEILFLMTLMIGCVVNAMNRERISENSMPPKVPSRINSPCKFDMEDFNKKSKAYINHCLAKEFEYGASERYIIHRGTRLFSNLENDKKKINELLRDCRAREKAREEEIKELWAEVEKMSY